MAGCSGGTGAAMSSLYVLQLSCKSVGEFRMLLIYRQVATESLNDAFYFTCGFDEVHGLGLQLH